MTSSAYSTNGTRVTLNNVDLWEKFYPTNEMVVTKPGRKLFPDLEVMIEGYHFARNENSGTGGWEEIGPVKDTPAIVKKAHNRGGMVGSKWMEAPVSFSQIYITNDPDIPQKQTKKDPILVTSMLKYQPVITVKRVYDGYEDEFRLTITEFMVVTAYQDPKIIELKKEYNKYANVKRPHDETPRRGKRANPAVPSPSFGTPAIKMVGPPSWAPTYFQTPTTPSAGPPTNFQKITPFNMATPPSMGATPPTPVSGGPPTSFQGNQFMTPSNIALTPSTMITPPSMGGTPPTPSSGGFQDFQNSMWTTTSPAMAAPSAYDYTWNDQYGTWDMTQKARGAPQGNISQGVDDFQGFQQFGNLGNVPQNNIDFSQFDGAGTSSQSGPADFDSRF
ncbi:unnamed protein product [Caenorhabditis brenneri]